MIPRILIGACAAIVLFLGGMHLAYTFFTHKFSPTEGQAETAMKQAAPLIRIRPPSVAVRVNTETAYSCPARPTSL